MAELTEEGLVIRRQPEVLASMLSSYQELVDPNLAIRDDEKFGQDANITATKIAELEEGLEVVVNSQNPLKAEGTSLDDIGVLLNVPRQAAAKSYTSTQSFTQQNGYILNAGSILENPNTLDRFVTTVSLTITTNACTRVEYSINTVLDSTLYRININDTAYTFTSDGSATALEIITGLKASIDTTSPTLFTATLDTDNTYLVIEGVNNQVLKVSTLAYMSTHNVTSLGYVEAQEFGSIDAPSNSVTNMITSSSVTTTNSTAYITGRDKESDEIYRTRMLTTQGTGGKATVEAIQDDVTVTEGVTVAKVTENDTSVVDGEGRPANSFETVVQGGVDLDIATAVRVAKPAGIQSYGNTGVVTTNKYGTQKTIYITRPPTINLAFKVEYTEHTETSFPSDGVDLIKTSIVESTDQLSLGQDVIPINYFGGIITAVGSLEALIVSVQQITNQGDTPNPVNWQTTKLSISDSEYARTIPSDITVEVI